MIGITIILIILTLVLKVFYIVVSFRTNESYKITDENNEEGIGILCVTNDLKYILNDYIDGIKNIDYSNYEGILIIDEEKLDFEELKVQFQLKLLSQITAESDIIYKTVKGVYQSNKYDKIFVISQKYTNDADGLNAGSDFTSKAIILAIEENSVIKNNSLKHINNTFKNTNTDIVTGSLIFKDRIKHEKNHLSEYKTFQSLYNNLVERYAQQKTTGFTIISNRYTAFSKKVLVAIGGFKGDLSCDMNITCRVNNYMQSNNRIDKIKFVKDAIFYRKKNNNILDQIKGEINCKKLFLEFLDNSNQDVFLITPNKYSMIFFFENYILNYFMSFFILNLLIIGFWYNMGIELVLIILSSLLIYGIIKLIVMNSVLHKYDIKCKINFVIKMIFMIPFGEVYYNSILFLANLKSIYEHVFQGNKGSTIRNKKEKITI